MSISDELMWRYYEMLSFKPMDQINDLKYQVNSGLNPRDVKVDLAKEIIARFHDGKAAEKAHQNFIERFQKNQIPDDLPEQLLNIADEQVPIANLLKEAGLVSSTSEAIRMIKQGAVKIQWR